MPTASGRKLEKGRRNAESQRRSVYSDHRLQCSESLNVLVLQSSCLGSSFVRAVVCAQ